MIDVKHSLRLGEVPVPEQRCVRITCDSVDDDQEL
jgi:hypothetical protein